MYLVNHGVFKYLRHPSYCGFLIWSVGTQEASTSHYLFFFPEVPDVWKRSDFWYHLKKCSKLSFMHCGFYLRDNLSIPEFALFVMYVWDVWKEICKLKHNYSHQNHLIKIEWVSQLLAELRKRVVASQNLTIQCPRVKKWSKPPEGHFRLDVDAGCQDQSDKYDVRTVIRDNHDIICDASAQGIRNPRSVLAAELFDNKNWLIFASQYGLHDVWVLSEFL